mgnify:CR=1 FL=1
MLRVFLYCVGVIIFLSTSTSELRAENLGKSANVIKLPGKVDNSITEIPTIYIQTRNAAGKIIEEPVSFTDDVKQSLVNSLKGIVYIFDEVNKSLEKEESDFEIHEIEISASLEAGLFKIISAGGKGGLKIIIRSTDKK